MIAIPRTRRAFCNCFGSGSPSSTIALVPIFPAAGKEAVAPDETTPGIFFSCGINALKKRPASSCLNCDGGKPTRKVRVFEGSIPISIACVRRKLRTISPAPARRTRASATSPFLQCLHQLRTRGLPGWEQSKCNRRCQTQSNRKDENTAVQIETEKIRKVRRERLDHQIDSP